MPSVHFTPNLARHVGAPDLTVDARTVAEALERVFAVHPGLRGYVLDDQGGVRHHIAIFVDGAQLRDRHALGDAVAPAGEIWVMQALSGG